MSDIPKRIWAARGLYTTSRGDRYPMATEYVRADISDELLHALRELHEWIFGDDAMRKLETEEMALATFERVEAAIAKAEGRS